MNDPYAKFIRLKDSKCPTKTYFKVVVHYVRMEKDGTQKQQVSYLLLCTCVVPVFSCSKDVDPVYQFAKRPISCCTLSAIIDFRAQMSFLYYSGSMISNGLCMQKQNDNNRGPLKMTS